MRAQKGDLITAVRSALTPSQWLGLFPCSETGGAYTLSFTKLSVSVLICAVLSVFSFSYVYYDESDDIYNITQVFIMNIACLVSLYEIVKHLGSLNEIIECFEEVDLAMNSLGQKTYFTLNFKFFRFNFCSGVGAIFFKLIYNLQNKESVIKPITEQLFSSILIFQIITLGHRYSGLLLIVSDLLHSCKREIIVANRFDPNSCVARLGVLVEVYSRLCRISADLNSCFGLQILVIMFASLVICILAAHNYISCHLKDEMDSCFLLLLNFFTVGVFFNLSNQIFWSSRNIHIKADEFNGLLYQLVIDDKTGIILSNRKLQLHFSMKRKIVFTAYGFFNLDNSLVHSMLATATTYLIILIQFGQSSELDKETL